MIPLILVLLLWFKAFIYPVNVNSSPVSSFYSLLCRTVSELSRFCPVDDCFYGDRRASAIHKARRDLLFFLADTYWPNFLSLTHFTAPSGMGEVCTFMEFPWFRRGDVNWWYLAAVAAARWKPAASVLTAGRGRACFHVSLCRLGFLARPWRPEVRQWHHGIWHYQEL